MAAPGEWLGVLSVDLPDDGRRLNAQQQEILAFFAEHAAIAIQHARLHSQLERSQAEAEYAATHDSLTGLANRALLKARIDALSAVLPDTAQRLREAIAEPICGTTGGYRIGASVGYALGRAGEDYSRLVPTADAAMYREKRRSAAPVP